jgi:hypothetical protein
MVLLSFIIYSSYNPPPGTAAGAGLFQIADELQEFLPLLIEEVYGDAV